MGENWPLGGGGGISQIPPPLYDTLPVPTAVNLSASVPNPTTQPTSWSSTLHPVTINPFTSPVGPTVPISASPLEVLELFFSADLMEKIVEESNRYANQVMGDEKFNKWTKVTVEELDAFLGFHILMDIIHLPAVDDYWRGDPLLHYAPIADRITRDRFRELSRYLHFVDNDTLVPRDSPGYDRLGKVQPLIDHLSKKLEKLYQPHREVAINEAMIKFQGRSSLKQYNPMKPIKRGIKVWSWQRLFREVPGLHRKGRQQSRTRPWGESGEDAH